MGEIENIKANLICGEKEKVVSLVQKEIDGGTNPSDILNEGLIKAMDIVGQKMENGDMFIPEVLMSAKIMSAALDILKPHFSEGDLKAAGKIAIGTVKGDLHDIGKNLVRMMLECAGFETIDLGVDVIPEKFVDSINEKKVDIVAISALLTTTMPMMKKTIDNIKENGFRERVKIMIGGAPVNQKFANEIGADGYASDAGSAVRLAKQLIH